MDVTEVLADLLAEQEALDVIVAPLTAEQLALPTPSPRWTVADQLAHLTYFDRNAALAIEDPEAFPATITALLEAAGGGDEAVDEFVLGAWRRLPPAELVAAWREGRAQLAAAAATLANDTRIAWYGPSMGAKSFLTARLMEVWAHGQDIVDTVAPTARPPTASATSPSSGTSPGSGPTSTAAWRRPRATWPSPSPRPRATCGPGARRSAATAGARRATSASS